jgi:putative spermidine/putrescine transport system substrate-binding protein
MGEFAMKIRSGLVLCGTVAATMAFAAPAISRDLTVTAWGGSSQAAQRKVFYEPFMKATGLKLVEDTWSGGIGVIRTKVQSGDPNWDVVQVEGDENVIGCDEGLYVKPDWNAIGGKAAFLKEAVTDCGVGSVVYSSALTYDADRLKDGPKSWVDFWDLKKFPGKRTLRKTPKYTLEFALMADGVPPDQVYKVLRTPAGVDRAFKKLDEIKSSIVWWTAGSTPPELLNSGEVVMAGSYVSRILAANKADKKNFKVVWDQSMYALDYWVILKGTPHPKEAGQLLAFMTKPENQAKFPTENPQGVTTLEGIKHTDPEVAKLLSTYPDNMRHALAFDAAYWVEHIEDLTQRFNAWVSR